MHEANTSIFDKDTAPPPPPPKKDDDVSANTSTKDSDKDSSKDTTNNWTHTNSKTVREWKENLNKSSFVHSYVLSKYTKKLNTLLLTVLILSTFATLISSISSVALTVNDPKYNLVALIINVLILVVNATVTGLNGTVKLYGFDNIISKFTTFIENANNLYTTVSDELLLPKNLREDAVEFIKKENDIYLALMRQSPTLSYDDQKEALQKFNEFLQDENDNFKYSQLYKKNDNVIEIV
jgi:hypothetical protein